jgi:Na+-translocating ferredoxin:NAD+ oxidoreductase RnfC subunit
LTVAGDLEQPVTLRVPIGAGVAEVLKSAGVEAPEDCAVIDGGPMMGPLMKLADAFVTKKSKGYIVLRKDHPLIVRKSVGAARADGINRAACEQCRMCTDLCPRYLIGHDMQPHKLMRIQGYAPDCQPGAVTSYLCSQCGLCQFFSCPAGLYPKQAAAGCKQRLIGAGIKYTPKEKAYEARNFRAYRLVSTKRLIGRLGLRAFDKPAPLRDGLLKPDYVRIPTLQHVGVPAIPTVVPGERVQAGQVIARAPENSLGVPVHAGIAGVVEEAGESCISIRAC